jgi:hypothetical protein
MSSALSCGPALTAAHTLPRATEEARHGGFLLLAPVSQATQAFLDWEGVAEERVVFGWESHLTGDSDHQHAVLPAMQFCVAKENSVPRATGRCWRLLSFDEDQDVIVFDFDDQIIKKTIGVVRGP